MRAPQRSLRRLATGVVLMCLATTLEAQSAPDTSRNSGRTAPAADRRGPLDWLMFWRDDRDSARKAESPKAKPEPRPAPSAQRPPESLADRASRRPTRRVTTTPSTRLPNPLLEGASRSQPEQTDTSFGARLGGPYPNPAASEVRIDYTTGLAPGATLRMYDFLGKPVRTLSLRRGAGQVTVEVGSLPPGLYFYSLEVEGKVVATRRLVISR